MFKSDLLIAVYKNLTYFNNLDSAELGHFTNFANMGVLREQLEQYLARMEDELDKTINFWLEKSGDKRNG